MGKFITDQILGMKWLNTLIGNLLGTLGLDATSRIGGSIQFFLYDVIKITVLLCVLIYLISYIQSYLPPERSKKIMGRFHGNTILLLLVHSTVYRIYQCRTAAGCDLLIPDFIAYGGLGKSCSSDEYFRGKGCDSLCGAGACDCCGWRYAD